MLTLREVWCEANHWLEFINWLDTPGPQLPSVGSIDDFFWWRQSGHKPAVCFRPQAVVQAPAGCFQIRSMTGFRVGVRPFVVG